MASESTIIPTEGVNKARITTHDKRAHCCDWCGDNGARISIDKDDGSVFFCVECAGLLRTLIGDSILEVLGKPCTLGVL